MFNLFKRKKETNTTKTTSRVQYTKKQKKAVRKAYPNLAGSKKDKIKLAKSLGIEDPEKTLPELYKLAKQLDKTNAEEVNSSQGKSAKPEIKSKPLKGDINF